MIKKLTFFLLLAFSVFGISCQQNSSNQKNSPNQQKSTSTKPAIPGKPEVKRGINPIADDEIAVIEMENSAFGTLKLELYSNIAPQAVKRFKELAKEGFYNGTAFHRIENQVIQGGDPNSKDNDPNNDGVGNSGRPNVPAELSDIPYEFGTLGAARMPDFNSANCQFFISLQPMPMWTENYTVFGKVIDGQNNLRTIAGVPKNGSRPLEKVTIKSITFQPK